MGPHYGVVEHDAGGHSARLSTYRGELRTLVEAHARGFSVEVFGPALEKGIPDTLDRLVAQERGISEAYM